jgi:hypothetical protein
MPPSYVAVSFFALDFDNCTVCTAPPADIFLRFRHISDGLIAVHCLEGLSRTFVALCWPAAIQQQVPHQSRLWLCSLQQQVAWGTVHCSCQATAW